MFFAKTTISAALVAAVNGHMIMKTPAPFDPAKLNNSPLDASGSDFPCKFSPGVYDATGGTVNTFELGSSQPLSFIGSAVHGGGSCQVVMTYDNPPTKDSKWKVIHSIEGGCPAKNVAGNLPEDPNGTGAGTYTFKIPEDIPTGKGSIGWTWFNRIGNREMYMNCGALELTGKGGDQANFDKLPDMVVLNIGSHPQTPEGVDYKFAEPGPSVEDNTGPYGVATCSQDGCQAGGSSGSGSGSGSGSDSGSGSGSATTSAAASPSSTPAAGNGGGVFLTTPTGSAATSTPAATSSAAATTTAAAATTTAAASSSAAASPSATPSASPATGSGSGSSGSATTAGTACSSEGMWNCVDGSSYQQCASGQWSAVMPMAAGTKCTPGQSMNLNMIAAGRRVRAFRA
ncbi:hypothetical protein F5Y07DRAFT_8948 [Xylaria sp. FL0933]|nr:hypothetical protein F5Y07DRAFT_8948 [Xylaria sp. FL0933]